MATAPRSSTSSCSPIASTTHTRRSRRYSARSRAGSAFLPRHWATLTRPRSTSTPLSRSSGGCGHAHGSRTPSTTWRRCSSPAAGAETVSARATYSTRRPAPIATWAWQLGRSGPRPAAGRAPVAHSARGGGPDPRGARAVERGDRRGARTQRGHRQDSRQADTRQAERPRSRPGRGAGLRGRARDPGRRRQPKLGHRRAARRSRTLLSVIRSRGLALVLAGLVATAVLAVGAGAFRARRLQAAARVLRPGRLDLAQPPAGPPPLAPRPSLVASHRGLGRRRAHSGNLRLGRLRRGRGPNRLPPHEAAAHPDRLSELGVPPRWVRTPAFAGRQAAVAAVRRERGAALRQRRELLALPPGPPL